MSEVTTEKELVGNSTFTLVALLMLTLVSDARGESDVALQVESPVDGATTTAPVPLVEIRGRVFGHDWSQSDVMVAIDVSSSSFLPSGYDVDRDGQVGELIPRNLRRFRGSTWRAKRWTTDSDDTIAAASLALAGELLKELDLSGARAGLLTFAGKSRLRAEVGDPEAAIDALARLRLTWTDSGTNLARASLRGMRELERAGQPEREKILVILSDGEPTSPNPAVHARSSARRAAVRLAGRGIKLFAISIGDRVAASDVFESMGEIASGRYERVTSADSPALLRLGIRAAELQGVRLFNLTAGRAGRAVRLRGDGSFDGFLPLRPGRNELEIRAETEAGQVLRELRTIAFVARAGDSSELLQLLQTRTTETELAARARRGPGKRVEILVENGREDQRED